MKRQKWILTGLAAMAVVAGLATVAMAEGKGKDRDRDERVSLSQTPIAVQQTIQQHSSAADIRKIERENEKGQTAYSVEIVQEGKESELEVATDGTLTSADEEMALGDAPEAVQAALAAQVGEGRVAEISKRTEKDLVQYEATIEQNGEERELVLTAQGQVTEKEEAGNEDEDEDRDGQWGKHKGHGEEE